MSTSNLSLNEKNIWYAGIAFFFVFTVCMFLGSFWLYNQWQLAIKNQEQIVAITKYLDDRYVDKDLLKAVTDDQNRRFYDIDKKIDSISTKTDRIHELLLKIK